MVMVMDDFRVWRRTDCSHFNVDSNWHFTKHQGMFNDGPFCMVFTRKQGRIFGCAALTHVVEYCAQSERYAALTYTTTANDQQVDRDMIGLQITWKGMA